MAAIDRLRVGIFAVGGRDWFAGVTFIQIIAQAVGTLPEQERPEMQLVIQDNRLADFSLYLPFAALFDGIIYLGSDPAGAAAAIGRPFRHCASPYELFCHIDFLFPVNSDVFPAGRSGSWIPDFQHRRLPDMFNERERLWRDARFAKIAAEARLVVVSSETVREDFRTYYPESPARLEVLTSRVYPENEWYSGNPAAVQGKYGLPDRFILCANQFWVHKNHLRLFEAIALLRGQGQDIPLVCTGLTNDYRFPDYCTALENFIASAGIGDLVHILGFIPRADQVQLMRRSMLVVQPSLFEGLSLIVQECLALGKPLVLSDLDIHLAEGYGTFFSQTDSRDLAVKILETWQGAIPGPDPVIEAAARVTALELVRDFAREFCTLARSATRRGARVNQGEVQPIAVATSIAPRDLDNQRLALDSWRRQGFKVISLNAAEEIAALQPFFPGIEFVPVSRDARWRWGKAYVFFDDLIDFLRHQSCRVCGLINSDIHLFRENFHDEVYREASDSFVFGSRFDVSSLHELRYGRMYNGFDFFFFDREYLPQYPAEDFCLGLPWWDYWIVLVPIAAGLTVKRIVTPCVCHLVHEVKWDRDAFIPLGLRVAWHVSPPFTVGAENVRSFCGFTFQQLICAKCVDLLLPDIKQIKQRGD